MKKQMLLRQSAMQKTLKYNLDESYAQGYNDAREEIAKEIEAEHNNCWAWIECSHIEDAVIARGQK